MKMALTFVLLALFAGPASADAVGKPAAARLLSCDATARTASFAGDMKTFGRGTRLQMRFTLQTREGDTWDRVPAANFDTWLTAAAGKRGYVYTKELTNLVVGAAYRVHVKFRWRDASGTVVARTFRRSKACRMPDPRPNLSVVRVRKSEGSAPNLRSYAVVVENTGKGAAGAFGVGLEVDGMPLPDNDGPGLPAGERITATFEAPPCTPGTTIVATVDTTGLVEEADEADNTLSVPCPTRRR